MDLSILKKDITELSFQDIDDFCKKGYPEGIDIDYKKELSQKGLAKHFAAFSNTRGGLIIVGVEEDDQTGVPLKWEGIKNEGKLIERVCQMAANVTPLPDYRVAVTNEVKGKCFLLIRIFEGFLTPYYAINDSNVWVRTGNVSKPIDISGPDYLEILMKKKEKTELARKLLLRQSEEVYKAYLSKAERVRVAGIKSAQNANKESHYYNKVLESDASMMTLYIQPSNPDKELIKPYDIKNNNHDIRWKEFPKLDLEPIPDGAIHFYWSESTGDITCQQIYSKGLIWEKTDILRASETSREIYLWSVANQLVRLIQYAGRFYKKTGYQGGLKGSLQITGLTDVRIRQIIPYGYYSHFDDNVSVLDKYNFDIEIDTSLLSDEKALVRYFIEFLNNLYWNFGYENISEEIVVKFLQQDGLVARDFTLEEPEEETAEKEKVEEKA